ncbi:MAG: PEP-CTERM sorting domain-containing protein [Pelovirga sp.]
MRKMVSRVLVLLITATCGVFLFVATASAIPIFGEIQFEGLSQLTDGSFEAAQTFSSAKGLQFSDATVKLAIDDFAGLNSTIAKYKDFIFDSFAGPVAPLWTAGPFGFNLESLDVFSHTDKFLGMTGTGLMTADGFDDTKGDWIFTTQSASGLTGITFSAAAAAVPVPEPGVLLLLGSGMVGLALYRRRGMGK